MSQFSFEPIGYIESVFKDKFGTPRQPGLVPDSQAVLKIRGDLNPVDALYGLDEFTYVWVIFVFHKNANKTFNAKIYPPRMGGGKIGVFATRSPHRPNAIGITCARLEKISGAEVHISGVDLIEGTPVLDIKPYIPEFDSRPDARRGWIERVSPPHLDVTFSLESEGDLVRLDETGERKLKQMVFDILSNDPRNPMDKETSREDKPLGFFLSDFNVIFSVKDQKATVLRIETLAEFKTRQS